MTTEPHQLELVPLEDFRRSELGRPVFAVRIPGEPVPWARGRGRALQGKDGPVSVGGGWAPNYRRWRVAAIAVLRQAWPLTPIVRPCYVSVAAVFTRPASWDSKPAARRFSMGGHDYAYPYPWTTGRNPYTGNGGDADNIMKAVWDTLQAEGQRKKDKAGHPVLLDDRIVEPYILPTADGGPGRVRWYAAAGEQPCVEVRIWSAV